MNEFRWYEYITHEGMLIMILGGGATVKNTNKQAGAELCQAQPQAAHTGFTLAVYLRIRICGD